MARSYGVVYSSVWDVGSNFRTLTMDEQWCYTMLVSQPQIDNLGVLPVKVEKWRRLASDMTEQRLRMALECLNERRMVLVDRDAGELLVRTFIRHDKVWSQPKLVASARKLIRTVESLPIRTYLVSTHPWLTETWTKERIEEYEQRRETPLDTPLSEPQETPSDRGIPTRAGARAEPGPEPDPEPGPYPPVGERPSDFTIPNLKLKGVA